MTDGKRTSQDPMATYWHGVIRRRRRRVPLLPTLLLILLSSGSVHSEIDKVQDKESSSTARPPSEKATTTATATATEMRAETTWRASTTRAFNDGLTTIAAIAERALKEKKSHNYSTDSTSPLPIVGGSTEETSALENTIRRIEKESQIVSTPSTFRINEHTTTPAKLEHTTVTLPGTSAENEGNLVDKYRDLEENVRTTSSYLDNDVSSTSSTEIDAKTKNNDNTSSANSQVPTTLITLIGSTRSVSTTSSPNFTQAPMSVTTSSPALTTSLPVASTFEATSSSTIEYEFIGLKENTIPPEYPTRNREDNSTSSTIPAPVSEQSTTKKNVSFLTTEQITAGEMTTEETTGVTTTEGTTGVTTMEETTGVTTTEEATGVTTSEAATGVTTTEEATGVTTMEEATEVTTTEKTSGVTTTEETSGVTTTGETTGATTPEAATNETTDMETSQKVMDETTESMRVPMTGDETVTEATTEKMLVEITNGTEITGTGTTDGISNETTEETTYWTTDNTTTGQNTEETWKQEVVTLEGTTETIIEEMTTEWEKSDYTSEETTARINNATDRNVYMNIPISRGTTNPGELTPLVKIIFEGTWMEVCPHLPGLRQSLADLLTLAVKKNVHVGQIVYQNNPCGNGTDPSALSSTSAQQLITTESSLTSLFLYVVDKEGNLDVEMTKMLPRVFRESSANLRVTIHSFQLVQEADSGNAIAVIIVSCVALLCLVLLTGLLLVVTSRRTRFNYGERCRPVSLDAYSLDSVSAYNSVRGRKGVGASSRGVAATTVSTAATLRASKRSYGNPSFDDSMTTPSHPLSFAGLSSFANEREKIAEEFAAIPRVTAAIDELPQGAEVKNRYANVVPLPETRVPLTRINNDPLTEYINASYVRGPKNATKYYIACQAPLESTVADFWRMIWEQRTKVVIMLTDLVENGVEKCAEYVPPSEVTDCHRIFGDFRVTLKKRETKEKYAISTILLKNLESDTFREIWHIWYMWPSNGVQSSDAAGLIAVLLEARALQRGGPAPILVHCSPGTGRTGTLIALDLAIRQYEITRTVDVPRVVYTIRRDRAGAVRTNEQYAFIYKALNLYATRLAGGACDS